MPINIENCKLLIASAASGDLATVKKLLAMDDVDVNYHSGPLQEDRFWRYSGTALYHAIQNQHEAMAELLIDHSAVDLEAEDIDSAEHENLYALCHAITNGLPNIAMKIFAGGVDPGQPCMTPQNSIRTSALGHAVFTNNLKLVQLLVDFKHSDSDLESDSDIEDMDEEELDIDERFDAGEGGEGAFQIEDEDQAGDESDDGNLDKYEYEYLYYFQESSVLEAAIDHASPEIVDVLLEQGIDPCGREFNEDIIVQAIKSRNSCLTADINEKEKVIKSLIKHGAKISFHAYLLMNSDAANAPRKPEYLLKDEFINFKGKFGITPLMAAVTQGSSILVGRMLEKGADITAINEFGGTAMTMAVQRNAFELMEHLARSREQSLVADSLIGALETNDIDGFRELIMWRKVDVNRADIDGKTLLMKVCDLAQIEMAAIVLRKTMWIAGSSGENSHRSVHAPTELLAAVDAKDKHGNTAFANACRNGNFEIANLLLEKGADINARDNDGNTALTKACAAKNPAAVNFLLQRTADAHEAAGAGMERSPGGGVGRKDVLDIDARNNAGQTALILCCVAGPDFGMVKSLVDHGADASIVDKSGCSALNHLHGAQGLHLKRDYVDAVALLENIACKDWFSPLMDDENLNFSFNEDISRGLSLAQKRALPQDEQAAFSKRQYFDTLDEGDELVQLAPMQSLPAALDYSYL